MENILLNTVIALSTVLITLTFVAMSLIQYLKEKWNIEGKAAEIVSLVVGFLLSGAVVVSYLEQMGWHVSVSQGIGIGIFVVVGTISPSGGYKTLRALLGKE